MDDSNRLGQGDYDRQCDEDHELEVFQSWKAEQLIAEMRKDPAMLREAIGEQGDDFFTNLLEDIASVDTISIGTEICEKFDAYITAVAEKKAGEIGYLEMRRIKKQLADDAV